MVGIGVRVRDLDQRLGLGSGLGIGTCGGPQDGVRVAGRQCGPLKILRPVVSGRRVRVGVEGWGQGSGYG